MYKEIEQKQACEEKCSETVSFENQGTQHPTPADR